MLEMYLNIITYNYARVIMITFTKDGKAFWAISFGYQSYSRLKRNKTKFKKIHYICMCHTHLTIKTKQWKSWLNFTKFWLNTFIKNINRISISILRIQWLAKYCTLSINKSDYENNFPNLAKGLWAWLWQV